MEKRERGERYRRSQALKQRHGGGNRGNASNKNSSQENPPRDKRENKSLPIQVPEKEVIDHTAIPDPHMFDNLKRETDDIAALTSKQHSKRQVFSNWSKYETLPTQEEDDQKIGEDYETLLRGAQIGAHFQLRCEKSWDPKKLPVQNAAFTIDLGVLASSLSCLPLYERLDLPKELFSTDDLEHMERVARSHKEANAYLSKRRGKSLEKEGLAVVGLLSEQDFQPLRCESLERGDGEVGNEGGDQELNFGMPSPRKDIVGAAVFKKIEAGGTPPQSISPSPPSLPLATPMTGDDKEEAEAAVETPSGPTDPPLSQQSSLLPDAEEGRPMEDGDAFSHETTVKKKSRGGKNKTNKRRSMEVESERSSQTSTSDKPQVALDAGKLSSGREIAEDAPSVEEVLEARPKAATVAPEKASSDAATHEGKSQAANAPRMLPPKGAVQTLEQERKGDELDELLSLKRPAPRLQVMNFTIPSSAVKASIDEDDTLPMSKAVITEKKEDLEDWLDSMLED